MSYVDTIGWTKAIDPNEVFRDGMSPVAGFILHPDNKTPIALEDLVQHIAARAPRHVIVDGDVWREISDRLAGLQHMLRQRE